MAVADRITVLRAGRTVGTVSPKEVNPEKLASMMVGREVNLVVDKKPAKPGETALEVKDLFVRDEREQHGGATAFHSMCARARCWASPACRATGRPNWSTR